MRLIDADELKRSISQNNKIPRIFQQVINSQPTAYSVGKVVEELKTDSSVKLYGSGNSDNYLIPVKSAIEIVKQGSVGKDVSK